MSDDKRFSFECPEQLVAWKDTRSEDAIWTAAISLGVVPASAQLETETYLPASKVRERLLSDEVVEAAAEATYKLVEGAGAWVPWDSLSDSERRYWIDGARAGHAAALAGFPQGDS